MRDALQLALEALEYRGASPWKKRQPAIAAIKQALAANAPTGEPMKDVIAKYDADAGKFLRTYHIRYRRNHATFEIPIQASSWAEAEAILFGIIANGVVHNELVAVEA